MSADQASRLILYQDCTIRVSSLLSVPVDKSLVLAAVFPSRRGRCFKPTPPGRQWEVGQSRADSGAPDGWAVPDRIIHEAPAYLKPTDGVTRGLL
jgi:hypothetical protein